MEQELPQIGYSHRDGAMLWRLFGRDRKEMLFKEIDHTTVSVGSSLFARPAELIEYRSSFALRLENFPTSGENANQT